MKKYKEQLKKLTKIDPVTVLILAVGFNILLTGVLIWNLSNGVHVKVEATNNEGVVQDVPLSNALGSVLSAITQQNAEVYRLCSE